MIQDPRIGSQIARYRIVSRVGRGGMGVVYLAEDVRLGRAVAIKVMAPEWASDDDLRRRFADREARLAASIEHPNVLPIHDAGEEPDGTLWFAMRYVRGRDLGRLLKEEGALSVERSLHLLGQVAAALDAAHEQGLIHRDVKPENILVEGTPPVEHVYLTDFGLTRRISTGTFTGSHRLLGTIHYASPELIEGRDDVDGRTDVYSLGCVLFQSLTGHVPFPHASDVSVLYAHLRAEPPAPSVSLPGLPLEMDDVIRAALAKRSEDRYPTCGALLEAAHAAAQGRLRAPSTPGPPASVSTNRTIEPEPTPGGASPERTTVILPPRRGAQGEGAVAISAQLVPLESRGRSSARHRVRIENRGRLASLVRLEPDRHATASAAITPSSILLDPGSVGWAAVTVRPRRVRAFGRVRLPVRVSVHPDGGADEIRLEGTMRRPPSVAAWGVAALALMILVSGPVLLARSRTARDPPTSGPSHAAPLGQGGTCPLTGMTPAPGQTADGPALAVKVDNENVPAVRPQAGLFRADLVFEEPIEFDRTRLVAIFHCALPDLIGPVRGPRPTDPDLLAQIGRPLFAFGNDSLAEPIDLSGVVDVSERIEPNGYSRTDAGAPYNLFAKPERLLATRTSTAPDPVFTYSPDPPANLPEQPTIRVPFENLVWRYDEGRGQYVRYYGHRAHESDGRQLTAANVILQYVPLTQVAMAGDMWVLAETVGSGRAVVYRDGLMIEGTWSRPSPSARLVIRDGRGAEIALAPGVTWIELVPAG